MGSPAIEEYLEIIYKLEQSERPVKSSKIASALGLHPTTVGEMLKRLVKKGVVRKQPGASGVELTRSGRLMAAELVRRHRLSERFLVDKLGLSWDRAHDEACRLEHALSDDVTESLERFLDNPTSCPHGHPIPDRDGRIVTPKARELSCFKAGESGIVLSVDETSPEMLSYLASLGLLPKTAISVEEVAPFGGPLLVRVGRAKYALGREVAARIMVEGA